MKKRLLFTTVTMLGLFLMLDMPMLAQSTGTSSSRSSSRESSRASRVTVTVPEVPEVQEWIDVTDFSHGYAYSSSSAEKNSKLTLSKNYEGATTSKKGSFNVEEGVKKIRISISGSVSDGKITVELYLPNEKEVGKFTMDNSADVSWSQSINIEEGDNKYFGEWSFVIKTEEAYGAYHLSLSTY